MKILSINKFFWPKGGSEAVFLGERALLEGHGHNVIPFSMKGERNLESPYSRFFIENVDYSGGGGIKAKLDAAGKIIFSLEARRKMASLLSEERPDVAHFHIFQHQISPSVFGPLRAKGVPLVLTLHDLKPLCPNYQMYVGGRICEECKGRRFYRCVANRCTKGSLAMSAVNMVEMYLHYALGYYQQVDKYIAVSRFYRDKMLEYGFGADQVVHLPNFIDSDAFEVSQRDDGYALYFGRLSQEKGLDTLVEAAALVDDIPLVLVGTGPLEEQLKKEVAAKGLSHVRFAGFQTGQALRELVAGASFTVLPSRWYENCPMSVLESFAQGKPVIGADIGGIPELISEERDGLTFESGNAEALAQAMTRMWSYSPEQRREMGLAGRKKVEEEHSPEQHYERLFSVYKSVL